MSNLSPQAQAVLDAIYEIKDPMGEDGAVLAAALRAVAMEVVLNKYQYADWQMADMIMKEIQAIANELDTL